MENIEQAIERARARSTAEAEHNHAAAGLAPRSVGYGAGPPVDSDTHEVVLSSTYLQSNRIISHMATDPRSRSFDMLRTQILQTMDLKGWKILAVTSPTPKCGKTVTALNLALSIARQPERSVLLVDMDLQRPRVATSLGLKVSEAGALSVLKGETTLSRAVIQARVGEQRFLVLPTKATIGSSEIMASRAMSAMMQDLKMTYRSNIIVMDLPPLLTCDDAIALLPQADCALLVAAVGSSTVAQVRECSTHLQSTEVVRIVVNKVPEASTHYYKY